ncbi:MAG: GIY-YIG nuclease family protein [Candidatus Marinimicrobia bacterium]|nr:GIY-YIG nuclease family protein [Candidatus Neomarinimicrobiota bacterium]
MTEQLLTHHVYLLQSESNASKFYKGYTKDIAARIAKHNRGEVSSTAKDLPWKLITLISFDSKEKALRFERYLKSHSGRAFSSKHF